MKEKFIIAGAYQIPATSPIVVNGADVVVSQITVKNKQKYSISGNCEISGVTVTLNTGETTTSASDGSYSFTGLANATYVVTPSAAAASFTPTAWTVNVRSANVSAVDFAATTIDATVTVGGLGISGATVTLTKGTTVLSEVTNGSGIAVISQVPDGTWTVAVSKNGYTYEIDEASGVVAGASISIGGVAGREVTVSGSVTDLVGAGVSGVTVTLTGGQTATTDSSGIWSIGPVLDGSYTATPTKDGWEFVPETQSVAVARANVTVSAFVGSSLPATGLVGYWPLTDGSAVDMSGKGHDLTISGSLTANTADPLGTASKVHQFTGSDYLSCADNADFDFGTGAFSLSMWANGLGAIGSDGFRGLVAKNKTSGQSPSGEYLWSLEWYLSSSAGAEYPKWKQDGAVVATSSGAGDMKDTGSNGTGVWYHVVLVRTASEISFYINNVKYSANYTGISLSNDGLLCIGGDGSGFVSKWKGGICHVRVYNGYALTEADVSALYNAKS